MESEIQIEKIRKKYSKIKKLNNYLFIYKII